MAISSIDYQYLYIIWYHKKNVSKWPQVLITSWSQYHIILKREYPIHVCKTYGDIVFSGLTLNSSSTIIHVTPSVPSPTLISLMCMANWSQKPMNELAFMLIPSRSFSWDVAITIAAADVKPADTGPDIKSIKNPIQPTKVIIVILMFIDCTQYWWNVLIGKKNAIDRRRNHAWCDVWQATSIL